MFALPCDADLVVQALSICVNFPVVFLGKCLQGAVYTLSDNSCFGLFITNFESLLYDCKALPQRRV